MNKLTILAIDLAFAVAILTGAWFAGAHHNELKHQAAEAKADTELVKQVQKDALNAVHVNQVVAEAVNKSNNEIKELASHAKPHVYVSPNDRPVTGTAVLLDADTVGLLDTAAQVPAASAPERSDAASQTASAAEPGQGSASSPVSVDDLVQYNFTLIGLYNELAKRHDALVDFVEDAMKAREPQR